MLSFSTQRSAPDPVELLLRNAHLCMQHDWFVDDDGNFLLQVPYSSSAPSPTSPSSPTSRPSLSSRPRSSLTKLNRASSFHSISRSDTTATAITRYGIFEISFEDLQKYIDQYPSLQTAHVVSSECYSEPSISGDASLPFLIFELRRPERKNVWLRVGQRMTHSSSRRTSFVRFLTGAGGGQVSDKALLSADKDHLVGDATPENSQTYDAPPVLPDLVRVVRIIAEEISAYQLWPESSWFFCSLVQQHLSRAQSGWLPSGILKDASLANSIRLRISARVEPSRSPPKPLASTSPTAPSSPSPPRARPLSRSSDTRERELPSPIARVPSDVPPSYVPPPPGPSTSLDIPVAPVRLSTPPLPPWSGLSHEAMVKLDLAILKASADSDPAATKAATCLDLSKELGTIERPITNDVTTKANALVTALDEVDTYLGDHATNEDTIPLRQEMIRLQRVLYAYASVPLGEQDDLARYLRNLGMALHRAKRSEEACVLDAEALVIRRENYRLRPSASRKWLAAVLHGYSIHLHACKRLEEACAASAEAVTLRRMLYEYNPEEYREVFAASLENYNIRLGSLQRFEEAVKATEEALVLRRIRVEQGKEGAQKDLADALHNHAISLDDLGRVRAAREANEECTAIRVALGIIPSPSAATTTAS